MTDIPHPRHVEHLFGQERTERALLDAYRAGRLHHGLLFHGPRGIGKATLAFRLARFLLRHPDPSAPEVRNAQDLHVSPDDPVFRQTAAAAHPDLSVLESGEGGRSEVIPVGDTRRLIQSFSSTAGAGGWRVAIIDPAENLNLNAANALLKTLEEPPDRAVIILVSHAPGRLPVTIRSRTARFALQPLAPDHLVAIAGPGDDIALRLADGSVARYLTLREAGVDLYTRLTGVLANLPRLDLDEVHALLDNFNGRDGRAAFRAVSDLVLVWLESAIRLTAEGRPADPDLALRPLPGDLASWIDLWEKTARSVTLAERLNLDRKQALFPAFLEMAALARARA